MRVSKATQCELDWEALRDPLVVQLAPGSHLAHFTTASISRDEHFYLRGVFQGPASGSSNAVDDAYRAGELMRPVPPLSAVADGGAVRAELLQVHRAGRERRQNGKIEGEYAIPELRVTRADSTIDRLSVWCLNGPLDYELGWLQPSDRDFRAVVKVARDGTTFELPVQEMGATAADWCRVAAPSWARPKGRLVVANISTLPPGYRPLQLDFDVDTTKQLGFEDLEAYLVALGFVLGREIVPIGITGFSGVQWTYYHARTPWNSQLRSDCAVPSKPPVALRRSLDVSLADGVLTSFVQAFQSHPLAPDLQELIWRFRIASSGDLEVMTSSVVGGLEHFARSWIKHMQSGRTGYLPHDHWSVLREQIHQLIEGAVPPGLERDRLIGKSNQLNSLVLSDVLERFYVDLGLALGPVERAIFKARNRGAHGAPLDPARFAALIATNDATRALLHRTVLRVVGWEGNYVDYSSLGFPDRPLDTPLGGPEGDQLPAKL